VKVRSIHGWGSFVLSSSAPTTSITWIAMLKSYFSSYWKTEYLWCALSFHFPSVCRSQNQSSLVADRTEVFVKERCGYVTLEQMSRSNAWLSDLSFLSSLILIIVYPWKLFLFLSWGIGWLGLLGSPATGYCFGETKQGNHHLGNDDFFTYDLEMPSECTHLISGISDLYSWG